MSVNHKSLRLGDLLVEKGLISAPQLRQAIDLQKIRSADETFATKNNELGEILIELGFLSRHQLVTNLSWQRRLRATTAMMVFVAPLLTAACGGGGGGGSSAGSTTQPTGNVAAQTIPDTTEKPASNASVSSAPATVAHSSSSVSSAPAAVVTVSSAKSSSSVSSVASSAKSSSSSSAAAGIDGAVQLLWSVPTSRENGDYLDISEIGGYEVRYKLKSAANYTIVTIKDPYIDAYYFDHLSGEYEFQIATFDKEGLYSKFVPVDPT